MLQRLIALGAGSVLIVTALTWVLSRHHVRVTLIFAATSALVAIVAVVMLYSLAIDH